MSNSQNTITVNGKTYVEESSPISPTSSPTWTVFVLEHGWVLLGHTKKSSKKGVLKVVNASNVRKYGGGIGVTSFVKSPENLVLDPFLVKYVEIPRRKLLFSFPLPNTWTHPDHLDE